MRVVSLLPSLTELVCALGRRDWLVGVTHECDYPVGVERLPHLTSSRIPSKASSAEIDARVAAEGGSLYDLDSDLLAALEPDLILTQAQCDVCAVNEGTVRRFASELLGSPRVESVNPTDLGGIRDIFLQVGESLGAQEQAQGLYDRIEQVGRDFDRVRGERPEVTVALLEWLDPPYSAGHWIPELIGLVGGREVLGRSGEVSRRVTFEAIAEADPDVLLLSPCGFSLERSGEELPAILARPEWKRLRAAKNGRVTLVDGSAYFSRPGPRLAESAAIVAASLHAGLRLPYLPSEGWRLLPLS